MKKLIFIFLVLGAMPVMAQRRTRNLNAPPEVVESPRTGHAIGAVLSLTNGNGLAYRYWPKRLGIHVAMFPNITNNNSFFSVGGTGYYTLKEFNYTNKLFLHVGMDYAYRSIGDYYSSVSGNYSRVSDDFNVGVGPGIETHSRYGSFSGYLGYAVLNKSYRGEPGGNEGVRVTLTGGISYFFEI